jgi:integrase
MILVTDAGARTVPLDAGTVAAIRAHRRAQLAERMAWGSAWVDSGKVFTRENGERLHPAMISDRFLDLVTAACLPPVRLHDLRHGAASLMLAADVDLKVVQEILGHSRSRSPAIPTRRSTRRSPPLRLTRLRPSRREQSEPTLSHRCHLTRQMPDRKPIIAGHKARPKRFELPTF